MGDLVRGALTRHGVGIDQLVLDTTGDTGRTLVLVDEHGERRFVYTPGVNAEINETDLAHVAFNGARLVHVSDFFLMPHLVGQPMADFFAQAQAQGLKMSQTSS